MMDRMTQDEGRSALPDALCAARVVALLPATSLEDALAPIEVLIQEGISVVSLPPAGDLTPQSLAAAFGPRLTIGVHDLQDAEQARWAVAQGAAFALSVPEPEVAEVLAAGGVPNVVSALTPTEVANVWHSGVAAVQVVPAMILGNGYPAQLAALVPDARLVARGAESSFEIKAWLGAGAVAVCVGPKLWGDALEGGDLDALRRRARTVVEAAAPAKQ